MKQLIVVADWALDSISCQEIKSAVNGFLQGQENLNISFVNVTPSTIHTGFVLNQIVEIEERLGRPMETVIFQNTDPRLESTTGVKEARGAEFIIIKLLSGIYICGPNAGYNFSFIKSKIDQIYLYPNFSSGTQFRSRDLYSRVCAHLIEEMEDKMELEETHTNTIPEIRGTYVGHIDNYGNIKTTQRHDYFVGKFELQDMITIEMNGITKKARYVSNLFGGNVGELVIYPGSFGPKENPYLEITIWRHFTEKKSTTGLAEFNNPKIGEEIKITQ